MSLPIIIQGGMGVAISNWRLARAVSLTGQLGVVSGTLLPVVHARILQRGDPGGHLRRAFDHFPIPAMAARVWNDYYVPGGIPAGRPFKLTPMPSMKPSAALMEITVVSAFAEVFLAKEGHTGPVGLNLLEKIQLPTLPSLYGAMLAGVDAVLMGAGIPRAIPGILDCFARGESASIKIDIDGLPSDAPEASLEFGPRSLFLDTPPLLKRPQFYAVVSSAALAQTLAKKSTGKVDGFVVEGASAGGHNAPPRGPLQLSTSGEPVYGPRDAPDLSKFRELGVPFWLAGACSRPEKITEALALGAAGVQIGTAFAVCDESGLDPTLKQRLREQIRDGSVHVRTEPCASPTGFPFKVVQVPETLSDPALHEKRSRICDLGYLRQPFMRTDGSFGYRCSAEPVPDYLRKNGTLQETAGRQCLCNALLATAGLAQRRPESETSQELPLITAGDELAELGHHFDFSGDSLRAEDVVRTLLQATDA